MSCTSAADHATTRPDERFTPVRACWICGGESFVRVHEAPFEHAGFALEHPELHAYTGASVWLHRCRRCGFTQPEGLPRLEPYFDMMYDQRWSDDVLEQEFLSPYKDFIFRTVLAELGRRLPGARRQLLDVGAHVGKLLQLARQAGWQAEGIELNPRSAAFAARRTGLPVHRLNAHDLADQGRRYDAVTLIDVLEHIPDPLPVLRLLHRLTEPGGWIAVKVPCGPNQLLKEKLRSYVRKDRFLRVALNLIHVNHFTPRSLRLALENSGFTEVHVTTGAPELFSDRSLIRRGGSWLTRLGCYQLARLIPGGTYTPLALNLQAYARKPAAC